ncbi:siderophore ABC transporter substrate-binding protein [Corynebacterium pelargi]|uniref:Putative ABC transporter solute-binding protein YclQ n=1 Tax=Corynebacterium pelargi TaxID=1471400 RepID=A0A410WA91_9CORY|nr:ABC transporter substrate-binding protein [Corynebacterium pelargi]QAU52846.1 putative ABC transporter solute-binding protein YclQ precursor [Corynebacterium pelargi]GGG76578.1 iron ABC transporter substrate-binding protein [Corynebacterium pelargi]
MKLKAITAAMLAAGLGLAACSNAEEADVATKSQEITIEDNFGDVTIPLPVERVASTDNRTFEVLEDWDVPLVAVPKGLLPDTVEAYRGDDVADMGMHREPDLEALVKAKPDLIISGQRFSQHYEDMKKLNPGVPIVDFEPRDDQDFFEELKREVIAMGKIFDKESDANELVENFDKAAERAKKAYNGNDTVMAVNVSGGEIGYIAPKIGRTYGQVFELLDLKPALDVDGSSSNHEGDDISVEAIAESDPDWIFVLDRDGAVNSDKPDYQRASKVIADSPALKNVKAVKDDQIVYAPQDTYVNESIITYTEMLNDIADAFEQKK